MSRVAPASNNALFTSKIFSRIWKADRAHVGLREEVKWCRKFKQCDIIVNSPVVELGMSDCSGYVMIMLELVGPRKVVLANIHPVKGGVIPNAVSGRNDPSFVYDGSSAKMAAEETQGNLPWKLLRTRVTSSNDPFGVIDSVPHSTPGGVRGAQRREEKDHPHFGTVNAEGHQMTPRTCFLKRGWHRFYASRLAVNGCFSL